MPSCIIPDKDLLQRLNTHTQLTEADTHACQQIQNTLNKFCSAIRLMTKEELLTVKDIVIEKIIYQKHPRVFFELMLKEVNKRLQVFKNL